MSDATVVLNIDAPGRQEILSCNGIPAERKEVKRRFEEIMATRQYFAYVETSPGKAEQIRDFKDVEKFEKKLGKATVTVQPSMQGG